MLKLSSVEALSFDCYGTLIDWQSGILAAVKPVMACLGRRHDDDAIIGAFAAAEREAERPPYRTYKDVQRGVMAALLGDRAEPRFSDTLWRSIGHWPAFEETPGALRRLNQRFRLAVVSNIDDDLFAWTLPKLGVAPEVVVTAEQVRSYKPGRAHFDELLRRLKLRADQVLHVAESRRHDVEPAGAMGFPTVWVNRSGESPSASGKGTGCGEPDVVVRSLAELVEFIERR